MAFCRNCGKEMDNEATVCLNCGASVEAPKQQSAAEQKVRSILNTTDTTAEYDATDVQNNKVMAILAYIGPLVLIPIFAAKESKFARFHANQGLVLLIAWAALSLLAGIVGAALNVAFGWWLSIIPTFTGWALGLSIELASAGMIVFGIIAAAQGKAKELPFIGNIRILK